MSYSYEWNPSSDSEPETKEFYVWDIANTEQGHEEIAKRIEVMQKNYTEMLEIAERFGITVNFDLKSELNRGHNRDAWVHWNPSSQHC